MAKVYGGRWEVKRSLKSGGQAETFVVEDTTGAESGFFVLKRLRNVARLDRFEQEVKTIQGMSHRNVVRLVAYDLAGDKPYLVTEYCEGGSLADHPGEWASDLVGALNIFAQICDGVGYAHARRVTHRDIKPENVLLKVVQGTMIPVIADFGICHVEDGERITLTDEAVGARRYTPPELADGRADEVTPRSDVYSLGKLLYWMLANRSFDREQHRDARYNLMTENHPEYEHVNRMLDLMIVADQNRRVSNADRAAAGARHTADLIARGARAIGPDVAQRCDFCKQGFYEHVVKGDNHDANNFGLKPVGSSEWHTLVCGMCGHVQLFRADLAQQKVWWGPRKDANFIHRLK